MPEKLTIRRRSSAAQVAPQAPVSEETNTVATDEVTPEVHPAEETTAQNVEEEVSNAVRPVVNISRPTISKEAIAKQKEEEDKKSIAVPEFLQGSEMREISKEEMDKLPKPAPIVGAITLPRSSFGERHQENKLDENLANDLKSHRPATKKISEGHFFSESHKETVIQNNNFVENNTTNDTVLSIDDNKAFESLLKGEIKEADIIDDPEYAQAASRSVIATISSYYSVVMLHSGYKANFVGLKYLGKSRLLTSSESMLNERKRLYETVYNQIESMTGGKPSFEKWCKITSFHDTPALMFGVYAATYPTPQTFTITCPKCGNSMEVKTDPESITAVYDEEAREQVLSVINNAQDTESIFKNSALSKIEVLPLERRKSVIYIKEPSIADFLDILSIVSKDYSIYEKFEDTFEKTMYIDKIVIPDIAHYKREGQVRFVKITDKIHIAKFIANLESDEGEKLDEILDSHNKKYDVRFEIPGFKCNGLMKDSNGNWTNEACGQDIEAMPLDMERILFYNLRKKKGQPEEEL